MNTLQPMYLPSTDEPKHTTVTPQTSSKRSLTGTISDKPKYTTVTPQKSRNRSHTEIILGILFGVMSLLIIPVIIVLFCKRYRGRRQLKFSDPDIG